jgi:cell division protein FtsQ
MAADAIAVPKRPRAETPRSRMAAASKAPKRPSRLKLWIKRRRAWVGKAGIGAVVLAGGVGIAMAILALDPAARLRDAAAGLASLGRGPGLAVQEIRIEGRENAPREALLRAVGIAPGDPILDFSPHAAKQRLEEIAWVESAHVERRLPGTIQIRIVERRAFAVWQRDGRFAVIDREGRVMATERLEAFGPLPLVVGTGAERVAAPMVDLIREHPEIASRVQAMVRVSERRWNLRLHNGADVLLPEGHEAAAVARLAELHQRDRLLDRPLASVDMRLPDRLVLRMQNQAPPNPAAAEPAQRPRNTRG